MKNLCKKQKHPRKEVYTVAQVTSLGLSKLREVWDEFVYASRRWGAQSPRDGAKTKEHSFAVPQ